MKKLYIHIGLPKTASSLVQKFLYENPIALSEHGLHYVKSGLDLNLRCHHKLVWTLGLHVPPKYVDTSISNGKEDLLDNLIAENTKYAEKDLIISSELLTFLNDFSELGELLDIFCNREILFVVVLRPQDEFLESLYQQIVKDGSAMKFWDWVDMSIKVADYNYLVRRIMRIAETGNILLDFMAPHYASSSPVSSFLSLLGVDTKQMALIEIDKQVENPSLSRECIEAIRLSNEMNLGINYFLVDQLRSFSTSKARYLTWGERIQIRKRLAESNRDLFNVIGISEENKKSLLDCQRREDEPDDINLDNRVSRLLLHYIAAMRKKVPRPSC